MTKLTEDYPTHYNEVALHFKRRFENLKEDIFHRVEVYENHPHAVEFDPNNQHEDDDIVFGSDGEIPEY